MTHFAVLIPVAKQMDWASRIMAVLTPITRPLESTRGPPEFPGLSAASVWITSCISRPEPALFHAQKVLDICQREGIGDFDLAFAYEALARAHAIAGDLDEAHRWAELARAACADIAEDGDREITQSDLETLPAGV